MVFARFCVWCNACSHRAQLARRQTVFRLSSTMVMYIVHTGMQCSASRRWCGHACSRTALEAYRPRSTLSHSSHLHTMQLCKCPTTINHAVAKTGLQVISLAPSLGLFFVPCTGTVEWSVDDGGVHGSFVVAAPRCSPIQAHADHVVVGYSAGE